jgi:chromosome segregation ATPase
LRLLAQTCTFSDPISYGQADNILHSRTAAITSTVLKEYKELITNTTTDLQDHLKEIDAKLEVLSLQGSRISSEDAAERELVQEEKDSTKQCLTICALVSKHIDQVRPLAIQDVSAAQHTHQVIVARLRSLISAKQVTNNVLKECQEKLTDTASDLERHLQEIENRQQTLSSQGTRMSDEDAAERERVQEEKESIKQCLSICAEASRQVKETRTNVFEDVASGDDSHQVIVATLGDLISAKRVTTGNRGAQWLGQMSDGSLQELSRARVVEKSDSAAMEKATEPLTEMGANELSRARGIEKSDIVAVEKATGPLTEMGAKFVGNYGAGYKLE